MQHRHRLPRRTALIAVASTVATALVVTALPVAATPKGRAHQHAMLGAVLARQVHGRTYVTLRELQRIADANGGTRGYDQPGFAASVRYVVRRLRQAGYRVQQQRVPYTDFTVATEHADELSPQPRAIPVLMTRWVPSTPPSGLTARIAVLPSGRSGCSASDYAGFAGRIAVVPRASCGYTAQQALAAQAGAVAFLVSYPVPAPRNNYRFIAFTPSDFTIPMGSISQLDAERLIAEARHQDVRLRLVLRGRAEPSVTTNVIAETAGGDPRNVVVVGGHLDSVTEGPGINDNGSTAAAVLATAQALAPYQRRVVNKVRFAWWGAEELVDIGSDYYVAHLSEEQRGDIHALLNGELLGSPNAVRHVWDGGPSGGHAIARRFERYFDDRSLPYEVEDPALVGSDHEPFEAVRIPVGGLDSGLLAIKTPEEQRVFGGVAGQLEDPCYHQPCDRLSNVNRAVLDQDAEAVAFVVGQLAIDDHDVRSR